MATPTEYIIEVQTLLADGWAAQAIHRHFKADGRKIGINTIFSIKRGDMRAEGSGSLTTKRDIQRMDSLQDKVDRKLEKIRNDIVARTTHLEEGADMELAQRLENDEIRKQISASDLTKISDSAAKRRALAENKPTDIFRVFDEELSNRQIIEIIQQQDDNTINSRTGDREEEDNQRAVPEIGEAL